MNGPVPSKCPLAPLNQWHKRENGRWRGIRRDAGENSNNATARPIAGSSFVAPPKAEAEDFSIPFGLFRRHAERARKSLAVMRPDLGIDDARRSLAVERVENLLGGDAAHVLARLAGDTGGVRTC